MVTQITIKGFNHPVLRMSSKLVGFQQIPLGKLFFTKRARMTKALNVRLSMPSKVGTVPKKVDSYTQL